MFRKRITVGLLTVVSLAACVMYSFGSTQQEPQAIVESAIENNFVTIFSKSYCPYCKRAKQIFADLAQPTHVIELDTHPLGRAIQEHLMHKTGQRTVPNVFIDGEHIGGADRVSQLFSNGQLQKLLKK